MKIPDKYTVDNDKPPLYEQIANIIQKDILNTKILVGKRLLPEEKLAASFGVSLVTIQRTLKILTKKNLLVRNRRGTFVSKDALRFLKHKTIGLIMPALGAELTLSQSPSNYLIFDGIQKFCHENSWDIQMIHRKNEAFSWNRISQSNIAGLIIVMPNMTTYELISDIKKHRFPFLSINLHSEKINKDVNFVNMDFYNAVIDAVKCFYEKGRKNIGILMTREMRDDIHQYHILKGYNHAMKALGLKGYILTCLKNDELPGNQADDFLRGNISNIKKCDAFITMEPDDSFSLFNTLNEEKIKIPEDISLITFYENKNSLMAGITSYVPDLKSIGYKSAGLLNEIFNEGGKKLIQMKIMPQLVTRKTG